jgi:acyl transferase domain-containing protein
MKKVLSLAVRQGAHKAELLDVAVPSHCPLMEPVARSLKAQLATIRISDPTTIYIANMNARAMRSAEEIRTDLAESVAHGVRWNEATNVAKELGCAFSSDPSGTYFGGSCSRRLRGCRKLMRLQATASNDFSNEVSAMRVNCVARCARRSSQLVSAAFLHRVCVIDGFVKSSRPHEKPPVAKVPAYASCGRAWYAGLPDAEPHHAGRRRSSPSPLTYYGCDRTLLVPE